MNYIMAVFSKLNRLINCCARNAIAIWPIDSSKELVRIQAVAMKTPEATNAMDVAN